MDDFSFFDLSGIEDARNEINAFEKEEKSKEKLSSLAAFVKTMNKYGYINLAYMQQLTGKEASEIIYELQVKNLIYQNPDKQKNRYSDKIGWEPFFTYVSGNVKEKMQKAYAANSKFKHKFDKNITALEYVLPEHVDIKDISFDLGANWIPEEIISSFICQLLNCRSYHFDLFYSTDLSKWVIKATDEALKASVLNNYVYGIPQKSAISIINSIMNGTIIQVKKKCAENEYDFDEVATISAQGRRDLIIEKFHEFCQNKTQYHKILEDAYNNWLVCFNTCTYNGNLLETDDLNPDIELYEYQKSAILRGLFESKLLYVHHTGSGKTLIIICLAHILHKLNISKKNLIVVPNDILSSVSDMHRNAYPDDKILVIERTRFNTDKNGTLKHIRDHGDEYNAIYMAYSTFDQIKIPDAHEAKYKEEILKLTQSRNVCTNKRERAMIHSKIERLTKKLEIICSKKKAYSLISYDSLGISSIFIDESHNYKNIELSDNSGLHQTPSDKAIQCYAKIHATPRAYMTTATPLTNSMGELFNWMKYLEPDILEALNMDSFNIWANSFAEHEAVFEVSSNLNHIELKQRFTTFKNLCELMEIFRRCCHFHYSPENSTGLPDFNGYKVVKVPMKDIQRSMTEDIIERGEAIKHGEISRDKDNFLKLTIDLMKICLDPRLMDPSIAFSDGKIHYCAKEIKFFYDNYPNTAQLVISDIGVPKNDGSFSVYKELKRELIRLGIPEREIAFIQNAKTESDRKKLYKDINSAKVRVIIGSTQKIGVGVNIQERLIALHHLTTPWKPSDNEQSEGRILRRGNKCKEIFIVRYITEGSYDQRSYQILENKQKFISSFLSGSNSERKIEDLENMVVDMAEMKAMCIGTPLFKDRAEIENNLRRAKANAASRRKNLRNMMKITEEYPKIIVELLDEMSVLDADIHNYENSKEKIPRAERDSFGEELLYALENEHNAEALFDKYQGFDIILSDFREEDNKQIIIRNSGEYTVDLSNSTKRGVTSRIDALLNGLSNRYEEVENRINTLKEEVKKANEEIRCGNPYESEIETLLDQLKEVDEKIKAYEKHKKEEYELKKKERKEDNCA